MLLFRWPAPAFSPQGVGVGLPIHPSINQVAHYVAGSRDNYHASYEAHSQDGAAQHEVVNVDRDAHGRAPCSAAIRMRSARMV